MFGLARSLINQVSLVFCYLFVHDSRRLELHYPGFLRAGFLGEYKKMMVLGVIVPLNSSLCYLINDLL